MNKKVNMNNISILSIFLKAKETLSILISPSFAILITKGARLSRSTSAMAISNAGMGIIPLSLLMQKDINGLGAGSLMD